jgi:ABC-type phosphate transport system substrate-binding protein
LSLRQIQTRLAIALLTGLAALAPGLVSALPARAAAGSAALADCNAHNTLTHSYSTAALQNALATMPADMKEYTNCYDVIQHALLGGGPGSNNGTGSGSGGSFLPTPVLVVLVLLALGGATFGAVTVRRRRSS